MESMRVGEWFALAVGLAVHLSMVLSAAAILKKAGYSRWWSIVAVVPIANWVALIVFACSEWPSLRRSSDSAA